ncbi:hypothetical protein MMYC01_200620 [Madurella mycetomatis]|uniref:Uncharacterized protein n=1 Tax=Madurella mycetomatis TaxID=100816 RepID=A0A175WHA1_9PEZI|nr:hypothetical protein MMYC01_200620 [Madurella mycetomatis]
MGNEIPVAPPQVPGLWDVSPDPNDIPLPAPAHWRGSRELQELANARAREAMSGRRPNMMSYGPAPGPGSVSAPAPVPVPVVTPPGNEIVPAATSVPWQSHQTTPRDRAVRDNGNVNGNGNGPFMHYEDLDYFRPAPESEPKDESQIDGGVPRADTFPPIPEGMNRLRARRSWDRQRKRRRKKMASDAGTGDGWGGGGRLGAAWQYCAHWLPEISCCLLSLGLFAAIIAVLRLYDGRGLPDWPLTVSLNTVVAFLTAMCQVALIVPLTEGLSQLKWNSFARGERPLADFQTFEDAKRGPVGSARLLYKRKGRALGMSAATALLTAFLISPLTQGAITYPTRSFEAGSGTATVARSESYAHPEPYTLSNAILDTREKQAIQSGIYHPVSREVPHLQPICSSGECQWRNFSSLAVCAAVADITDRLTITNQTRPGRLVPPGGTSSTNEPLLHASLPNGLYLLGSTSTYNLNISWPRGSNNNAGLGSQQQQQGEESFLPSRTSLAFSDQDGRVSSAIANFFLIYTNQTGELPALGSQQEGVFRAVEVLFHFCVNTYQVSTSHGVSTSRVVYSSAITAQGEPASIRRGDGGGREGGGWSVSSALEAGGSSGGSVFRQEGLMCGC